MNLLAETVAELVKNGKSPDLVTWVGRAPSEYKNYPPHEWATGSWSDFVKLANFEYDDDYGNNKINMRLVVVGTDWWLERHEYDGSEWWEFKMLPMRPVVSQPLTDADLRHD